MCLQLSPNNHESSRIGGRDKNRTYDLYDVNARLRPKAVLIIKTHKR